MVERWKLVAERHSFYVALHVLHELPSCMLPLQPNGLRQMLRYESEQKSVPHI